MPDAANASSGMQLAYISRRGECSAVVARRPDDQAEQDVRRTRESLRPSVHFEHVHVHLNHRPKSHVTFVSRAPLFTAQHACASRAGLRSYQRRHAP